MTVIVTGASRGIGRAIADRLHSLGYEVLGISLRDPVDLRYESPDYPIEKADISDINSLNEIYEKVKNTKITGLVNSAGVFENLPFLFFPYNNYKKIIDVNLIGAMNMCSVFLKLMDKEVHTPIVNISSIAAHYPNHSTAYTASKMGLEGFTKSLAKDLSHTKIRPNCICPGFIKTDMTKANLVFSDSNTLKEYVSSQPIGIPLTVEHVADVVELLFNEKSNCVGGQSIQIG